MVTVAWYEVPAGARLARKAKPLPVLVAAGKLRFSAAGRGTLAIKLTPAGKVLLKHAKHVTLTARGGLRTDRSRTSHRHEGLRDQTLGRTKQRLRAGMPCGCVKPPVIRRRAPAGCIALAPPWVWVRPRARLPVGHPAACRGLVRWGESGPWGKERRRNSAR